MNDDQRCLLYFNLPFNEIVLKEIEPIKFQPKNILDVVQNPKEKENKKGGFIPKKD